MVCSIFVAKLISAFGANLIVLEKYFASWITKYANVSSKNITPWWRISKRKSHFHPSAKITWVAEKLRNIVLVMQHTDQGRPARFRIVGKREQADCGPGVSENSSLWNLTLVTQNKVLLIMLVSETWAPNQPTSSFHLIEFLKARR